MSGGFDDIQDFRALLERFIDVADRIPFMKPTKSNKSFVIPYKTLFNVLKEYSPLDNSSENEMQSIIEEAFKSGDDKKIENTRRNFVQHLQSIKTRERLYTCLNDTFECYDDSMVRVLNFFKKSCDLVSQKRKTTYASTGSTIPVESDISQYTQETIVSPVYSQLLVTLPFDTYTTEHTLIQTKINLKSSDWKRLKKTVSVPKDLIVMCSSIFYGQNVNPNVKKQHLTNLNANTADGNNSNSISVVFDNISQHARKDILDLEHYLSITPKQINLLKLYLLVQSNKEIYVLFGDVIVDRLSKELRLNNVVNCNSSISENILKRFISRHSRKINQLTPDVKNDILPLKVEEWSDRHISRLIKHTTCFSNVFPMIPNESGECFRKITVNDLDNLVDTGFIKRMTSVQQGIAKRFFGTSTSFSDFVPNQVQYLTALKFDSIYSKDDTRLLNYISVIYNINVVVFNVAENRIIDVSNEEVDGGYCLFICIEQDGDISILKYKDTILVECDDWNEWINSLGKWEPTFSEIWSYFCETGQHVPPIKKLSDKKDGLVVYNIPFITQNYKTYISHIVDSSKSSQKDQIMLKRHGVYCMQYRDAFDFVKRQSSKRHMLHYKSSYESMSIRDLLFYIPLRDIHQIIIENSKHGIFCENVSPIFKKVAEFDNTTMLKWWMVSYKFKHRIRGYFTEFGSMYFEEIYDTSIDPVSETCVGYQWKKMLMFNNQNVHTHGLTPHDLVLVLASIYIQSVKSIDDLLSCEIPVHHDYLKEKKSLDEFFSWSNIEKLQEYQGFKVQDHIVYNFIEEYFCTHGPFAIFVDGDIDSETTRYIFEAQVYYNQVGWLDETVQECLVNVANSLKNSYCKVSIPIKAWNTFIRTIPKTEKYEQLTEIPNIPCLALYNGQQSVIQSYDVKRDKWRIVTDDGKVYHSLQRDQFSIIENDRVLPADCIIHPLEIEEVVKNYSLYISGFDPGLEYTATVIEKIDDYTYIVNLNELDTYVKLKKDRHFHWKHGIMMEMEKLKTTEYGNTDQSAKYSEDRSYDKGFSSRGSNMKTKMYHPIRKDAYLPSTDDVELPDYIKEDENLCKLLDKEFPKSIFPFIDYTAVEISNDELYGTYGLIMDRHGDTQTELSYDDILMMMITDLWNDMTSDRLNFNVTGVIYKLGDNVIDMKEEIIKQVYNITK